MGARLFKDDIIFLQQFLKSGGFYRGKIDGLWGTKTDAAAIKFDEASGEVGNLLGFFDWQTERAIITLNIAAQVAARHFMSTVLNAGINARIISGTRTYAEQNLLFKKGRYGNPGPIVTKAKGGYSNHNFGIAWDIGIFSSKGAYLSNSPLYKRAAQVGLADVLGLEWGGNWSTFKDAPHYQLSTGLTITQVRERFEKGLPYIT